MKISIIGAGAMGSLYGGKLSIAGNDVVLYDINKAHVDMINTKGLIIEESSTGEKTTSWPLASSDPQDVSGSDLMIIFVKSTATEAVAEQFVEYAKSETIALTLQNGLGNEDILRDYFGAGRTAAGVTSQGATFLGPGEIRHAGNGPTHICMSDKNNNKLKEVVKVFSDSGFEIHIEKNIADLVWSKLVINVGINAVTALSGLENGKLLDYPDMKSLMADLVNEAVMVAEKKGVKLSYADPLQIVYDVSEKTALNRSSMLQDFDRGSLTEIDFINNAIVREGGKLGIATPFNSAVSKLVRSIELVNRSRKIENAK
ncbi:MAG: 2-dehydropantoate 2-reductase [Spirochaetia bacterium]|jgi:2-dehydropantoate 2-reductase|nr:2-dehydropantoate 2-reductase [Spirochaetia bacterium]